MEFRNVALMGLHNQPFVTESACAKHVLVVCLTPPGVHLLLGVPMEDLLNRWVDLDDIDKRLARRITEQVNDLTGWEALFGFMDSLIGERMAATGASAPDVAWAWERLRSMGGLAGIGSLARDLDWSHKRLLAQFRQHIGSLPKATADIFRFNRVLRLLRTRDSINWAAVAQDCGYHDQAHMIREFKTFAGGTPGEIRGLTAGFTLRDRSLGTA